MYRWNYNTSFLSLVMNDLQKKLAIVGSTAFIVWLMLAIKNSAFILMYPDRNSYLEWFTTRAIYVQTPYDCAYCGDSANWVNLLFFTTWLGSLIAFFTYKD